MSANGESMRMRVTPEPTDEELAVIVAAVTALGSRNGGDREEPPDRGGGRERWARAGRGEAVRSFERGTEELRAF